MISPYRSDERILCAGTCIDVPLPDRLAPARKAGFTAISVWLRDIGPDGLEAAAETVGAAGLRVAEVEGVLCWLPDHVTSESWIAPDMSQMTIDRLIPVATALGAPTLSVAELAGIPFDGPMMATHFGELCDQAADHGLRVALEFIPAGGISDLVKAWDVIDRAGRPNGGLVIDSWHFFRTDAPFDRLAAIPGDRIFSVQINDGPAAADGDLVNDMVHRLLPGEGEFNLDAFLDAIGETGTRAPIGIEILSPVLNAMRPADAIAACGRALDRLMPSPKEVNP